jgi:hypothetical protein
VRFVAQNASVRAVIERFGRHPHRNPIYGRVSSAAEAAYISMGDFPHLPKEPAPGWPPRRAEHNRGPRRAQG